MLSSNKFNTKYKPTIRILVSEECNYNCSYCCNNIPDIRDTFKSLSADDLVAAIAEYDNVVVTGGEPLIEENLEATKALVAMAKYMGKKVIVYTNLSVLPDEELVSQVDGWTVGYHDEEANVFEFGAHMLKLIKMEAKSVRLNIEASLSQGELLGHLIGAEKIFPYKLDDCDRSDVEDIYKIKEEK